jgi:glycerophosphoryl diester phosphodiesterase
MIVNLAHRGASAYAPENTLAAFYMALELEADGIETDVRETKDGLLILFHDKTMDKKTDTVGKISEYTLAELRKVDAGSWFEKKYKGERLVTFEEFLYIFGRKDIIFAVELKDKNIANPVMDMIYKYGVQNKTTITSFIFENLETIRKRDSNISLGYLIEKINEKNIKKLKSINARMICPKAEILKKEDVILAKGHGLNVRAWGVKDEDIMKNVLKLGIDGMTVNFPDKLKSCYKK